MATLPTYSTRLPSEEGSYRSLPAVLERISGLPLQVVIIFLITAFGGFVQVEEENLFEEHRQIVVAIFVALSLFALGCMAEYKLGSGSNDFKLIIIKRFSPLFGILVVALLLTISSPLLGLPAVVLWGLFMLEAIINTVKDTLEGIHKAILGITDKIRNLFGSGGEGTEDSPV